jgi:cold shock CspA family protein/ribosome-associated translation inhibitor RaiA
MQVPLQITFRNMERSESVARAIEAHALGLEEYCGRIISCRVVVDMPHRHHQSGNLYQVSLDVTVPGHEIIVNRESKEDIQFKDLDVALGHAFDTAARRLDEYRQQRKANVKYHEPTPYARVARLMTSGTNGHTTGYGFIETPEGREIYFHANSLVNGEFGRLAVGTEVTFVEQPGDKGPQASTVRVVGRHGHR